MCRQSGNKVSYEIKSKTRNIKFETCWNKVKKHFE